VTLVQRLEVSHRLVRVLKVGIGLTLHAEDWLIFLCRPFGRFHVYLGIVCFAATVRAVSWHSNCIPVWFLDRHQLLVVWGSFLTPGAVAAEASAVLLSYRPGVAFLLLVPVVIIGIVLVFIDS